MTELTHRAAAARPAPAGGPAGPAPGASAPVLAVQPFPGREAVLAWWTDLAGRAEHTFYLSPHWIGAWLAESGAHPFCVTARAGGELVGLGLLAPGRERRHRGLLSLDKLSLQESGDPEQDITCIEYNGFLVDRRHGEALEAAMLRFVAVAEPRALGLPDWDELRLGGVAARYLDHAAATGLAIHQIGERPTARVDLDAVRRSGKGYLEQLSANTRYQTRRAMKLYAARGTLRLEAARDVPEALAFFEAMAALHQPYWIARGSRGAFGYPFLVAFHRRIIADALPQGEVELLRISAGTEPIGYLYNFIHRGWVGTYLSGFAYEADAKLKPGYVAYALCVERHLALGSKVVDFLAGENRYKMSLGQPGERIVHFDLQRPRLALKLEDLARRARNRWFRRRTEEPAA